MTTDCIIENWIMKNKTRLSFLGAITIVWIAGVFVLMLFKHCYFNYSWANSRISLSNILSLGAAIGTLVFAWKQIEINQRDQKIELALRIQDHYIRLNQMLHVLQNTINNFQFQRAFQYQLNHLPIFDDTIYKNMLILQKEAELSFNEEINEINIKTLEIIRKYCFTTLKETDKVTILVMEVIIKDTFNVYKKYTSILREK